MDNIGPRSGSITPNGGSNHRFERPLPPIPGSELISVSSGNGEATREATTSIPPHDQYHVDMRGIYDENNVEEGSNINLHGVDGSLLDIYPSRSNSSLSVTSAELLTRAPYLEGVSNTDNRTRSASALRPSHEEGLPEVSSLHRRGVSSLSSNSLPVSLREFLGDGPSASRNGSPSLLRSAVPGSSPASTAGSRLVSREARGNPQDTVWRDPGSESTASVSVRTPTRTQTQALTGSSKVGPDDESSYSRPSGNLPPLSHDSSSQVRYRLHPSPSPSPSTSPDFVLPRWQPDAEVTFCPICRTQFSKLSDRSNLYKY